MLSAPSLSYMLLSPMLIIFGAAVLGVLIEAFMGKTHRAAVQLTVSVGALRQSQDLLKKKLPPSKRSNKLRFFH